jgi:hypothetical protein
LQRKCKIKSNTTIIDWFNFCQNICAEFLLRNPEFFGGENSFIEINEAILSKVNTIKAGELERLGVLQFMI